MPLVSLNEFLPSAKKEKFAVGQFNINNLEYMHGITQAAKDEQSPFIFGASPGLIRFMGIKNLVAIARNMADETGLPIALHLDHGVSFKLAVECIREGFSSVMFDGSQYPLEENIRLTKQVVAVAHAVGVTVEAELGAIGSVEDDVTNENRAVVDPQEAIYFWQETRVDALAIAVGTAHGMYKGEPKIHFDIIDQVSQTIEAPIVLHGGSGVPDEAIRKAISLGVSKINVNSENQVAGTNKIRELLNKNPDLFDPRKYLVPMRDAVTEVVRAKMRLFGSANKA